MCERPVLFLDSGIGGIPYCKDFIKENPLESVFYIADNKNFPYGPRRKEELIYILTSLTENILKKIDPKVIVLACNTATIAALPSLRQTFPQLLIVGTVPAIKPAAEACNNGKVGVLGTERTIEEINNLNLTEKTCEIFGISAPELVDFIEMRFDSTNDREKIEIAEKYIEPFRKANVDTLVLGCTHFLFLLEEFRSCKSIKVFDSLEGITKRIEHLLDENSCALRAEKNSSPVYNLFLTGAGHKDSLWQDRARTFGFNLSSLNDL